MVRLVIASVHTLKALRPPKTVASMLFNDRARGARENFSPRIILFALRTRTTHGCLQPIREAGVTAADAPRSASCAALAPHTCGRASLHSRLRTAASHRACQTVTCLRRRRWGAHHASEAVQLVSCAALARILPHTSASVRLCPCVSMRPCRSTALDAPLLWPCTLSPCAPINTRAPFQGAPAPCARCDAIARLRHRSRIRTCRLRPFTALVPVHRACARALRSCPCSAHVPVHAARARTASHVCERAARAVQCACARVLSILCASRPPVPKAATRQRGLRLCSALAADTVLSSPTAVPVTKNNAMQSSARKSRVQNRAAVPQLFP
jgi:hypothetical protein